jgi:hypothetical protein
VRPGSLIALAACCALSTAAPAGNAAEIRAVDVSYDDGRYYLVSETWFDAPVQGLFDVLTDYDRFTRISSVYKESRFLQPAPDGTPRALTRVEGCVLFFCQSMSRVERLEIAPDMTRIRAVVEPEASDFEYSVSTWEFREEDGGTIVDYRLEMEPGFWVPPVIGPYLMKRRLRRGGEDAIERIERLARESRADLGTFRERGLLPEE